MSFVGRIIHFVIEYRSRGLSYAQACQDLQSGGEKIDALLRQAEDTPANRSQAGHVIGMERWGIQRLSCLLNGTPPLMDEYDSHRPAQELPMPALADAFKETRATTLALAARLEPLRRQHPRQVGPVGMQDSAAQDRPDKEGPHNMHNVFESRIQLHEQLLGI